MKKAFNTLFLFILFFIAYSTPFLLEASSIKIQEDRVSELLTHYFLNTNLFWHIVFSFVASIASLFFVFIFIKKISFSISKKISISKSICFIFVSLTFLCFFQAVNFYFFHLSNYNYFFSVLNNKYVFYITSVIILIYIKYSFEAIKYFLCLLFIFAILNIYIDSDRTEKSLGGKNIIIIGIDSLSMDAFEEAREGLPYLNEVVSKSEIYSNAYTPIGRTFPAWLSILSGLNPAEHRGIFNLRGLNLVDSNNFISNQLQKNGYETIFAIDERRFNNMNEDFGFNKVIGPKVGSADFILQTINDNPLNNILMQLPAGKYMQPFSYINVASYANYSYKSFVTRILQSFSGEKNIFLSVHFESPHYPFLSRGAEKKFNSENKFKENHYNSLTTVDKQIELLLENLKKHEYLENALLIILSDHGESLGDNEFLIKNSQEEKTSFFYGHGTSVLSQKQSRIILSITKYENGKIVSTPNQNDNFVSLLDINPLLKDYAINGGWRIQPKNKCLIVETGIRFIAAENYRTIDKSSLAIESAKFYEINKNGLLQLREDYMHSLFKSKDIGLRCTDKITYYSTKNQMFFTYLLDKKGNPEYAIKNDNDAIMKIKSYYESFR